MTTLVDPDFSAADLQISMDLSRFTVPTGSLFLLMRAVIGYFRGCNVKHYNLPFL